MPRIDLITDKSQLAPDRHAEFDQIVATLHSVRGPFAVLMQSPGLAEKVMSAGAQVRLGSTLTPAERELAVLGVAREKDATYEWAAHIKTGREVGVREEAIEAVRNRGALDLLEAGERLIISFVRELLQTNRVSEATFQALIDAHDVRWLVELAATVGQYQYISAINNTFEVEASPDADQLPI
jgi:4-carboxymuconolactone decarboxylase